MREKLAELPVEVEVDAAGNQWATLAGEFERARSGAMHRLRAERWVAGRLPERGRRPEVLRRCR